ncbi:MAG TPA: DUF4245 family protein [Marmoricola sp.]
MSQPGNPRTQRSFAGMAGALIVVVVLVLLWFGFRALTSENEPTPVRTVDWQAWVKSGRAEHQLLTFAPTRLPAGWRATSVDYAGGRDAHWHVGMLTDTGRYVGIEESTSSTDDLVEQYIDEEAERGEDVVVDGQTWQTWTDDGGDYALARSVEVGGRPYESVLVGGSAPAADIRDFVETLTTGSVRLAG